MKIQELFMEAASTPELIKILERDCKPFLNIARGNGLLIRGVATLKTGQKTVCTVPWPLDDGKNADGEYTADLYKKIVRTDRKPLDTSSEMHKILGDWFTENFGYNARTESMFAFAAHGNLDSMMTAYDLANKYTKFDVCIVFPIGDFKYVWSDQIDDLYRATAEAYTPLDTEKAVEKFMDKADYTSHGLNHALKTTNVEIMVKCDSYYAVDWEHADGISKWLKTA